MRKMTVLYRPVGPTELDLVAKAGYRSFPPRLPEQPFFYPVCHEQYAVEIAQRWNVRDEHLRRYEPRVVGARYHEEYWIPAGELSTFNDAIVGPIEVIAEYRRVKPVA